MMLDISFELDCYQDDYKYKSVLEIEKGDRWISYHTELGKYFLEYYGWYGDIHKRFKVSYKIYEKILKDFRKIKVLSCSIGGFYWLDKKHIKHL